MFLAIDNSHTLGSTNEYFILIIICFKKKIRAKHTKLT